MLASNIPTTHRDDGERDYRMGAHRFDRDRDEYVGEADEVDMIVAQVLGPVGCANCRK